MSNLRCKTAELNPLKQHCLFCWVQQNFSFLNKIFKATYLCTTKQILLVTCFVNVIELLLKATSRLQVLDTIILKGSICLQSPNYLFIFIQILARKISILLQKEMVWLLKYFGKTQNSEKKKTKRVVRSGKDWQVVSLKTVASFENSNLHNGISYRHLDCLNNCSFITHD